MTMLELDGGYVLNMEHVCLIHPCKGGRHVATLSCGQDVALTIEEADIIMSSLGVRKPVTLEALRPEQVPAPPESKQPQGSYQKPAPCKAPNSSQPKK